jgi:hypothetical protein
MSLATFAWKVVGVSHAPNRWQGLQESDEGRRRSFAGRAGVRSIAEAALCRTDLPPVWGPEVEGMGWMELLLPKMLKMMEE